MSGLCFSVCSQVRLKVPVRLYHLTWVKTMRWYKLWRLEAYHQNFYCFGKADGQTHMEFGDEEEALFDRWRCSGWWLSEIPWLDTFSEDFRTCVPDRIAININEQKVSKVSDTALLADDYVFSRIQMSLSRLSCWLGLFKSQTSPQICYGSSNRKTRGEGVTYLKGRSDVKWMVEPNFYWNK